MVHGPVAMSHNHVLWQLAHLAVTLLSAFNKKHFVRL